MKPPPYRHGVGLLILSSLLTGCAVKQPEKFVGVNRVSANGAKFYFDAKKEYGIVRALDLSGPPLATAMDRVITLMDGAVTNDPKNPLFVGKRGDLFIELGPDAYDRAESDLMHALKITEDWVPAWIGLSELAARRGNLQLAMQHCMSADKALGVIEQREGKNPVPTVKIYGLTIFGPAAQVKDFHDPKLAETERRQLMLTWLQEEEQFVFESPTLLTSVGDGKGVNSGNLMRRLHARIEFQQILVQMRSGEKGGSLLAKFDRVLQWDPDFFPARVEKAATMRKLAMYRDAERLLRPYVESKDPKLSNNARLLYEMASIYTDWYIQEPESKEAEKISKLAEECFTKLVNVNQNHAEGWIKRAELYATAGSRAKNAATLADARRWLNNAREILKTDTPEIKRVEGLINQPLKPPARQGT